MSALGRGFRRRLLGPLGLGGTTAQDSAEELNDVCIEVGRGALELIDGPGQAGLHLGALRCLRRDQGCLRTQLVRVAGALAPDRRVSADQDGSEYARQREQSNRLLVRDRHPERNGNGDDRLYDSDYLDLGVIGRIEPGLCVVVIHPALRIAALLDTVGSRKSRPLGAVDGPVRGQPLREARWAVVGVRVMARLGAGRQRTAIDLRAVLPGEPAVVRRQYPVEARVGLL